MIYPNPNIRSSYRDGYVIATFICDTVADLPALNYFADYTLEIGSTAHVIGNATDYEMQSDGTWCAAHTTDLSAIISQLSDISGRMENVEIGIGALDSQVNELHAAAVHLIDGGNKNILPFTMPSSGVLTLTDNGDGTFYLSGTASTTISLLLGRVYGHSQEELVLSGCPSGGSGSSGYSLMIADEGGSLVGYDEGEGYSFTRPAAEEYFRVYCRVRAGTYNNLLFKPMVTYQEYYKITPVFVPYSPTNAELYALIRSYHP